VSIDAEPRPDQQARDNAAPLVEVEHLKVFFPIKSGLLIDREVAHVHAVNDVSLAVAEGETIGLVGESGCGKTTISRTIMRLIDATDGTIHFRGNDITDAGRKQMAPIRREMQMVFQDPFASLNPRKRVAEIIGMPLRLHGSARNEVEPKVRELLGRVGLHPEHINRYPHEFSGGQRQRIGVARSLALRPKLIVCDEPVSALDVSIQAQILNLLDDLQEEFNLTYLFIAHDLSVVKHVSDRVAVMYLGKIVEMSDGAHLYRTPKHPYTGALLSAVPMADPDLARQKRRIILQGDVPSPIDPPSGCRFHPRCPQSRAIAKAEGIDGPHPRCIQDDPELTTLGPSQIAACHFPLEGSIIEGGGATERFEDAVESQEGSPSGDDPAPN
jgi:oligopeptide/dipeptide ABC transporter ATP-binding protein